MINILSDQGTDTRIRKSLLKTAIAQILGGKKKLIFNSELNILQPFFRNYTVCNKIKAKDAFMTDLGLNCVRLRLYHPSKMQSSCVNLQPPSESFIVLKLPVTRRMWH